MVQILGDNSELVGPCSPSEQRAGLFPSSFLPLIPTQLLLSIPKHHLVHTPAQFSKHMLVLGPLSRKVSLPQGLGVCSEEGMLTPRARVKGPH